MTRDILPVDCVNIIEDQIRGHYMENPSERFG